MIFLMTLFRYFIKLFHSFHYISFPFLKGCRLEKGHIVLVLCSPFIKKLYFSLKDSLWLRDVMTAITRDLHLTMVLGYIYPLLV